MSSFQTANILDARYYLVYPSEGISNLDNSFVRGIESPSHHHLLIYTVTRGLIPRYANNRLNPMSGIGYVHYVFPLMS